MASEVDNNRSKGTTAKAVAFLAIAVTWIALDQFTKSFFIGQEPGGILAGPFAGIFDIRLVHNTGGAWGMFAESTFLLGMFSVVVCAALAIFFFVSLKQTTVLQTVSFALIVGGGVGNAIDRFTQGFVTDFIEFSFIQFPVFNIADIGVTCGFAILIIALLKNGRTYAEEETPR